MFILGVGLGLGRRSKPPRRGGGFVGVRGARVPLYFLVPFLTIPIFNYFSNLVSKLEPRNRGTLRFFRILMSILRIIEDKHLVVLASRGGASHQPFGGFAPSGWCAPRMDGYAGFPGDARGPILRVLRTLRGTPASAGKPGVRGWRKAATEES